MSLSHDDVERIIRLLDNSHFDELTLEADGVKLALRRGGASIRPASQITAASVSAPAAAARPESAQAPATPAAVAAPGLVEIKAPMLGTFYRAPKPGAQPFVQLGAKVAPEDCVGIIEVMKLMNSVSAGFSGEVVEILAKDGELVEYDQVLVRVRPD